MADLSNIRLDARRLWASLMEMGTIGGTAKGGCNRLTLTDLDKEGRGLFQRWCEDAGLSVSVDQMGNMFARRAGADASLPPVLMGSHLDTQPTGGKFDGILGVLGALEVMRSMNDLKIKTRHPIEIANWTNEEGARYAPAMVASGVFAGAFTQEFAYGLRDSDGKAFGEELERIGFKGSEPVGKPVHAYFELHIEQGPILEDENLDVGIVTHGQGMRWFDITLNGFESHAGSTPMPRRKDALVAASRVVQLVQEIGLAHPPYGVATCGRLSVYPGSRNVIPGQATLSCEFRHPEKTVIDAMEQSFRAGLAEIAEAAGVSVDLQPTFAFDPVPFDPDCIAAVRRGAQAHGYSHRDMVSGAGHDACYLARVTPTAMIFTPCVGGISHNEAEDITPAWASAGTHVLMHAVLEKAEIVS